MAERYPAFRAGQKVTGSLLASMQPITVRKVADTARATNTVSADPELQLDVEANGVYVFEGQLYVSGTVATDDINVGFYGPLGSDGMWGVVGPSEDAPDVGPSEVRIIGTAINSGRNYGTGVGGAANPGLHVCHGDLTVGSTAGTFSMQWARTAGAGTATVYADSWIKLTRIA